MKGESIKSFLMNVHRFLFSIQSFGLCNCKHHTINTLFYFRDMLNIQIEFTSYRAVLVYLTYEYSSHISKRKYTMCSIVQFKFYSILKWSSSFLFESEKKKILFT